MCRDRYDRVKAVQKTGESVRNTWHKTDWNKVAEDPATVKLPYEDWIHQFDAERHAEEVFDDILKRVTEPQVMDEAPLLPKEPEAVTVGG